MKIHKTNRRSILRLILKIALGLLLTTIGGIVTIFCIRTQLVDISMHNNLTAHENVILYIICSSFGMTALFFGIWLLIRCLPLKWQMILGAIEKDYDLFYKGD